MRHFFKLTLTPTLLALAACAADGSDELDEQIDSVIIVGTSVTKEIYEDGSYGLTLVPKGKAGEAVLGDGISVDITIDDPDGFTSQVGATACSKPDAESGLSVGVIIDDSGSMSSNDYEMKRKDAVISFIDALNEDDEVLLTDYGVVGNDLRDLVCANDISRATTSCAPAEASGFTRDKDELRAAVERIVASGDTPLYQSCLNMVPLVAARKGKQAILLLSDGVPSDENLRDDCHDAALAAGIPVYTVGLGPAAETDALGATSAVTVLRELSTDTGGAYASAELPEQLSSLFANIGVALTEGHCASNAILNEYLTLVPGMRVRGTVHVGANGASGKFEFVAPPK